MTWKATFVMEILFCKKPAKSFTTTSVPSWVCVTRVLIILKDIDMKWMNYIVFFKTVCLRKAQLPSYLKMDSLLNLGLGTYKEYFHISLFWLTVYREWMILPLHTCAKSKSNESSPAWVRAEVHYPTGRVGWLGMIRRMCHRTQRYEVVFMLLSLLRICTRPSSHCSE